MNKNLNKIAEELFGKIRSQFSNIKLGNEDAEIIDEPLDARYFEFQFEYKDHSLGAITISIDEDDGLVVMFSNDIIEKQPDGVKHRWFNFLKEMREFAKRRLLNFEARDILKSLDKKDYDFLSKNRKEKHMAESKLWGTNKTSYQNFDEARIVVKHSKPINCERRSNGIESIFIENSQGERFKYPYKHLNGARAMARHIANSGNPYDSIGVHITGLSEELSKLRMFKGYVGRNPVVSEAMDSVQTQVMERIEGIKKQIQKLHGQSFYENFSSTFVENEYNEIPEEIMNDWVDKLTIRVFNEDLTSAFPFIYKLMNNTKINTLTAEDVIGDNAKEEEELTNDTVSESIDEMAEYESYVDSLLEDNELFTDPDAEDNAVEHLNQLFSQPLEVGADGTNAIESLSGIIDDEELFDVFKELADVSTESDARGIIMDYIKLHDEEHGTDIASQLTLGDNEEQSSMGDQEEVPPAAPEEPAPEQPVTAGIHRFGKVVEKAMNAGAQLSDKISYGSRHLTLKDAIIMSGLSIEDYIQGEEDDEDHGDGKIREFVESMYDHHTGAFPKGETGVILSVEKQFGKPATRIAAEAIKNLRHGYESNRIKKLAGL